MPPRLAPHVRFTFDPSWEQHALLTPEKVTVLNGAGATIVGLCDGQRSVTEIVAELRGRYDRPAAHRRTVRPSGGVPLRRRDLVDIRRASELGLYTNPITSAPGLSARRAGQLRDAGLDHVQISLQAEEA